MKNLKSTLVAMVFAMFFVLGSAHNTQAQITGPDVIAAAGNLVNVQVGNIDVNAVDVIDVSNVLNQNDVTVIVDIIDDIKIDDTLNNLLRDAEIITGNQVVVGVILNVLGGVDQILVADKSLFKKAKKH
jgi:hypothetical protein